MRNTLSKNLAQALQQHVASAATTTTRKTSVNAVRSMASFRASTALHDKVTVQVPTMGDSITEGTIVEWAADIGQAVKVDDVIALVETDKVTIDIKASVDGVITKHFCNVEDNVEVGANLYEIDTEAEASASIAPTAETETPSATAAAAATATSTSTAEETKEEETKTGVRIPSIQFLGKDGWKRRRSPQEAAAAAAPTAAKPHETTVIALSGELAPMYGRMPFSEREMEALELGGASEVPSNF